MVKVLTAFEWVAIASILSILAIFIFIMYAMYDEARHERRPAGILREAEVGGHLYVFDRVHGGVCHSMSCPCSNGPAKTEDVR